jgi:hypothetical protein
MRMGVYERLSMILLMTLAGNSKMCHICRRPDVTDVTLRFGRWCPLELALETTNAGSKSTKESTVEMTNLAKNFVQ